MFQRQTRVTERICEDLDIYAQPPPEFLPSGTTDKGTWLLLGAWTVGCVAGTALICTYLNSAANESRINQVRELRSQNAELVSANKQLDSKTQHNSLVWGKAQEKLSKCMEEFNTQLKEVK